MRITGVEAAIARYREAGTKKDAHNRNCAQMGSAQLGVLLYYTSNQQHTQIHKQISCVVHRNTHTNTMYNIIIIRKMARWKIHIANCEKENINKTTQNFV